MKLKNTLWYPVLGIPQYMVYDAYSQYFQFVKTRTNYCANSPDGVIMIAQNNFYCIDIFVSRTKTKRNNPEKQTEQRLK